MQTSRKGIAIAGNIIVDIVNIIDKYPDKNMLANISASTPAVGGCVSNTIIDIAKIDPDMHLTAIGKVGNDDNGKFVVSQMEKYGIDTSCIIKDNSSQTACTYVMSEKTSGERTFFYAGGANNSFTAEDVNIDALDCKIFHAGYILLLDGLDAPDAEYGTKMAKLLHDVAEKGIKTSIDVVSEDGDRFREKVIPALKQVDYAIMNEIECCKVSGLEPRNPDGSINTENIKKTMELFFEYGVREKVIIHCAEAGYSLGKDGNFVAVPSLKLPKGYIKGSVGAGDAYCAASLYGIYKGYDDTRILEFASAAAACNLSVADSISGMRTKDEVMKLCELYEKQTL